MANAFLAALLRNAPGVVAQGVQGANTRRQQQYNMQQDEQDRADRNAERASRAAMQQALQNYSVSRDTKADEYRAAQDEREARDRAERDVQGAITQGYESATPDSIPSAMQAAGQAMGVGGGNANPSAMRTAPLHQRAGGVDVSAPDMGAPQYAMVGGRWMKLDRQRAANAKAHGDATDFAAADARDARTAQRQEAADSRRASRDESLLDKRLAAMSLQGGAQPKATEGERKAAALLSQANDAFTAIRGYAPSIRAQQLARVPVVGNMMAGHADPEGQAANQAGFQFSEAYLRYVSGAAVPETEVRRYMMTFLPQPGDSPQTVERKKSAQLTILNSLRIGAGPLAAGQPDLTQAGKGSSALDRLKAMK